MVSHLRRFDASEVARERLRIIKFYNKYGERATKEAFGVGRKTIFVWKKRLKESGLKALVPYSTAPKRVRSMVVHPKVLEYIRNLREEHPRIGKIKIKPLLDEYSLKENLPTYSTAKIGRIIKRYNLFYQKEGRVYHNPNANYQRGRVKRLRVKYAPKHLELGHIQMDTILRVEDGIKYYIYSAIDISGKFALSLPYKSLTRKNTLDFFKKLESIIPYQISSVQTDNGLEFLGVFEEYLTKRGIKHFFTYPKCPRINGVIERYQRSLQEEFIDPNVYLIHNQEEFQKKTF